VLRCCRGWLSIRQRYQPVPRDPSASYYRSGYNYTRAAKLNCDPSSEMHVFFLREVWQVIRLFIEEEIKKTA
jgi:hypothetical protein